MSYEFGFVLSFAQLKFLRLWFVRLDTERESQNYTTRVNRVKFFRAGVCAPTRARARGPFRPSVNQLVLARENS